jgi:hypothetical protein
MRLEIVRGFFSKSECDALNRWTMLAVENKWVDCGLTREGVTYSRLSTRLSGHRFVYPEIVIEASNRIRQFYGLADAPTIDGHGRDGIVVSCVFDGGNIFEHTDPGGVGGLATLRCNVLTQKPEAGGVLHLEGAPVELNPGDLHCYLASEHRHYVDSINGDTPRILWMFGAHVPAEDWNSGKIHA